MRSIAPSPSGETPVTGQDTAYEDGPPVCPVCFDVRGMRVPMELKRPEGADFGFFECPTCHLSVADLRQAPREKPRP